MKIINSKLKFNKLKKGIHMNKAVPWHVVRMRNNRLEINLKMPETAKRSYYTVDGSARTHHVCRNRRVSTLTGVSQMLDYSALGLTSSKHTKNFTVRRQPSDLFLSVHTESINVISLYFRPHTHQLSLYKPGHLQ